MLDQKFLDYLQQNYEITFNNRKLVERAMTHSSFDNEHKELGIGNYERLEFLGDAVLEINISRYLFEKYPQLPEGKLTRLRSDIVRTDSFARFAKEIQIDKYLLIGKGEEKQGARQRHTLLEDIFEAFNGALYLDQGNTKVEEFLESVVYPHIDSGEFSEDTDFKTHLQERLQQSGEVEIDYKVIDEEGPDHDKKFEIELIVNDKILSKGFGFSKKHAEQMAAKEALEQLK
ncbi:ribonuclease III [Companilactobacillus allii]|uniref:Ribonuclease 3 n=1 Tax=Companilactobacillus allii TaxID=1847728 RepID=A0A1P8Q424_9LACO|nr:ribonuclease III [Companilactobacillus allii]APX72597.1 ribonuclease III [Companilactobacillus allii]USQ69701.1 ribonuclease III [Companilactobacillus allii]